MKTKTKPKNTVTRKTKTKSVLAGHKKVVVVHAKRPVLRHFRLIAHKHTGKLIHFRHTSHVALVLMLMVVGFFLYVSEGVVKAETYNESILIGAIVPGSAPTVGATITSPVNDTNITDETIIDVSGTCESGTFVVIKDNGSVVGSTNCTSDGKFNLQVQLHSGENVLTAFNYDNINQSGPVTPSITINVTMSKEEPIVTPEVVLPVLPDNPSIIPGVKTSFSDCDDYKVGELPTGGEPHVVIVCIPRLFLPKIEQTMGILAWGGTPPYAVSIDFGYGSEDEGSAMDNDMLLTITSPGYKTVKFSYAVPNTYRIALKLTDNKGVEAIVQTAVQVNGNPETPIGSIANDIFGTPWLKTPVPIYLLAVAITLGFWGGDIFDRYFGAKKFGRRNRRAA